MYVFVWCKFVICAVSFAVSFHFLFRYVPCVGVLRFVIRLLCNELRISLPSRPDPWTRFVFSFIYIYICTYMWLLYLICVYYSVFVFFLQVYFPLLGFGSWEGNLMDWTWKMKDTNNWDKKLLKLYNLKSWNFKNRFEKRLKAGN